MPGQVVVFSDERGLPVRSESVDGTDYDFRTGRTIGRTVLDHAYTDLQRDPDGRARVLLDDPDGDSGITLWVDESYPYLMVFTGDPLPDVARRSLAVEPMTCPPNAFRTRRLADPSRAGRVDREHVGDRATACRRGRSRCPVTVVLAC